jgi:hypothetical protein
MWQLGELAASIYEELIALTPQSMRDFCAKHVRMRAAPSFRIEGAVYRSRRGSYCVILTIAMMTFLHKVKKFLIAHNDPSMVIYCNRDVPCAGASTLRYPPASQANCLRSRPFLAPRLHRFGESVQPEPDVC